MTIFEVRSILFANAASRFSLPLAEIKARLGEPASIRFLPRGLQHDQKNIVVFSYQADDGAVDVFCPVVLRDDSREWAVDGWLIVEQSSVKTDGAIGPGLVRELFDEVKPLPKQPPGPAWRSGRQLSLDDRDADV